MAVDAWQAPVFILPCVDDHPAVTALHRCIIKISDKSRLRRKELSVTALASGEVKFVSETGAAVQTYAKLWPNPASDVLWLEIPEQAGNGWRFRLLDMLGREKSSTHVAGSQTPISVSGLSAGMYHWELTDLQGAVVRRGMVIVMDH